MARSPTSPVSMHGRYGRASSVSSPAVPLLEQHEMGDGLPRDDPRGSCDEQHCSVSVDCDEVEVDGGDTITAFVWLLVSTAAISGLLFGQDLGHVLSDWNKEAITSSTTLGALLGGLLAGSLSDYTGRKLVIVLANAVFIAAGSVNTMITGRFVVGLGVGLASCIVPLYIGEIAPSRIRGRLVTMNAVVVTFGQVVAYGSAFRDVQDGWRWIVGLGAVPALVQLAAMGLLPESRECLSMMVTDWAARILLLRGNTHLASSILAKIYPQAAPYQLETRVESLRKSVQQSKRVTDSTTWFQRLQSLVMIGVNRRALVQWIQHLDVSDHWDHVSPYRYYSATIFSVLGFQNATAVGSLVALVNFLFTMVALKWQVLTPCSPPLISTVLTRSTGGVLVDGADYPRFTSLCIVTTMLAYVAGYATGLGNIPWQQGELFRLEVRGIGTSLSTATCWTGNLVVAATFLSLMRAISPAGAFGLYAVLCTLGWIFCYLLSLEEVSYVFENDFGVQRSEQLRADRIKRRAGLSSSPL
ncbi:hypothetical protein IAU60_004361 [Kwoniella sp. DSM 27419]